MSLIKCKVELSLKWIENCVLTTAEIGGNADAIGTDSATLEVTDSKLYVVVVTLLAEDDAKLVKQLNEGFKKPVYWNKFKVTDNKVVEVTGANTEKHIRELLDSSSQGVKRLFVLGYYNTAGNEHVSMIISKNISFQELKLKIKTLKLMEEVFMISELMTQLNNMMKSENYQQDRVNSKGSTNVL